MQLPRSGFLYSCDSDDPNLAEITLPPAPDTRSSCFNVSSVEGVQRKDQYLAVQLPPPSNLPDLWNFVVEKKVELIIVLQRSNDTEDPVSKIKQLPIRHWFHFVMFSFLIFYTDLLRRNT